MGTGGNNVPVIVSLQRKLTTDECLKIQGYPDGYKIKFNNSQSYKQIGNSVSVPVVTALAKEISKFI
jgi:DNA (cytosine-5)-methyltransferase 1